MRREGLLGRRSLPLRGAASSLVDIHLNPIEFLFDDVKGIVANLARLTQCKDSLAFGAKGEDAVLMLRLQLRRRRRIGTAPAFVLGAQRHCSAVHLALQCGEHCLGARVRACAASCSMISSPSKRRMLINGRRVSP